MSIPIHEKILSRPCEGYPYSNDRWTADGVDRLRQGLAAQKIDKERATALVIGAGGLPYVLGNFSEVVVVDDKASVLRRVLGRVTILADLRVRSWQQWGEQVAAEADPSELISFRAEYKTAKESRLMGGFEETQAAAREVKCVARHGDVVDLLPEEAERLRAEGREVSLINATNMAEYLSIGIAEPLRGHTQNGPIAVARLISGLPLAADALLIESYLDRAFRPTVHRAESFIAQYADL